MAQIETGMVCGCGMPMSRNPHPDAGKPDMDGVAAGYEYECIPCLVATRNRVGAAWREAQGENERLRGALAKVADRWEGRFVNGGHVYIDAETWDAIKAASPRAGRGEV